MSPRSKGKKNDIQTLLSQVESLRGEAEKGPKKTEHNDGLAVREEVIQELEKRAFQAKTCIRELKNAPSQVQKDLMYRLAETVSMMDMTVRANILGRRDDGYFEREEHISKHAHISICEPKNAVLRVVLPPLIGRKIKGSYNIYWKLKAALSQYEQKCGMPDIKDEKLVLIYKIYARSLDIGHVCDNDNWEMRRTTNAISEALNRSDNPAHFSMFYTAVESSVDCVEATVIYQKNLSEFLDYLVDSTPPQSTP